MAFKLVISDPKSGLSVQKEIDDAASKGFMGVKIGDTVKGELIDLHGYEFMLTGGSDFCGFPMRRDVPGVGRKKILAYEGVGVKKLKKGILQRKTVCGNTVHTKISQVNLKVTKQGTKDIFEGVGKKGDGAKGKEVKEGKTDADAIVKPAEAKQQHETKTEKTATEKPKEQPKKEVLDSKKEEKPSDKKKEEAAAPAEKK